MPTSSVSGVRSSAHHAYFLVPQGLGIDHLAEDLQFVGGGESRLLGLVEPVNLEGGVLADLFGIDTGMQRHRTHGVVRTVEVEHAEVRHHAEHVDEPVCRVVGIDLVPTDPGHDVYVVAEHPLGVVADPVTRRVVDRVSRRAPHTEHLPGRVLHGSECGKVLVAVPVDLIRAHHDMAAAPGQRLEDPPERHPALDRARRADRRGIGQQPGLAVGEDDVGGERQARQPCADRHHGRHRADHDFACVTEQFGARDSTYLCAGHGDHFDASSENLRTAAWYSASLPDR